MVNDGLLANLTTDSGRVGISVVIVTWNGRDCIGRCLDSLAGAVAERSFETIVVDNASTDDTVAFLRNHYPQVQVIESPTNLGYARGAQLGVERAAGEFVVVMNPDLVLGPGALDHLAQVLETRPQAVWVGPKIVDTNGQVQSGPFPLCRVWEPLENTPVAYRFYHPSRKARHDRLQQCERLSGALMMFRASLLRQMGGLPRSTFLFGEEILLGAKCRAHGYEVWYDPLCFVIHEHGASIRQRWDEDTRRLATRAGHLAALRETVSYPRFLAYDLVLLSTLMFKLLLGLCGRPFPVGYTWRALRLAAGAIVRTPRLPAPSPEAHAANHPTALVE